MKLTINYQHKPQDEYPYIARAYDLNGFIASKISDTSFKEAREKLITALKLIYAESKPELPKPEEIEI